MTRPFSILVVVTFLWPFQLHAQGSPDTIATLEQQWMLAGLRHDSTALETLMASDFRLVHPSQDSVTTRSVWLAAIARIETRSFRYAHLHVTYHGAVLAVASGIFVVDATLNDRPFTPVTSVTDVWERRNGHWQVVTRYATRPQELGPRSQPSDSAATQPRRP